jgi:hypothetical protein
MSVEIVRKAMRRFLSNPTPEVLCIKGKWGTGKTYAWEDAVKHAASDKSKPIALKKYAYVSLFGVKDSADIIQSVFANTDDVSTINKDGRLPIALGAHKINDIVKKLKAIPLFAAEHASVPHIAGLGGVARALISNFVHETLVCIDDFERKTKNVSVNEIMGTIAQLRDARKCKVVLILNEDSLDEEERAEFLRYSEKVIDTSFQFEPTPAESATIAFPENDPLSCILREACEQLEITNIRVMNKISSYAHDLMELLKEIDQEVAKGVIRSLVVIVWSITSPKGEGAPDSKYLSERRMDQYIGLSKGTFTDDEKRWGLILTGYGFTHCDEFDLILIDDVENGFFNDEKIRRGVETYLKDAKKARAQAAIEAGWKPFHDSFDDNAKHVAQSIFDGCVENLSYLAPANLSAAVAVLKDIGYPDQGAELLGKYMKARDSEDIFDRSEDIFGSHITDPDVIKAFDAKAGQVVRMLPTPLEAASRIYKGGWSPEDEESLAKLSVDDFVTLFKATDGANLSVIVLGSLQFRKMGGTTPRQKGIVEKAQAALGKIGKESPLNAHRMKKFNISIEATRNGDVT